MTGPGRQPAHPPQVPQKQPGEAVSWFYKAQNVRLLKWSGCVAVLVLFALDFFLHYHAYLGLEHVPGFYTVFGLLASVVLIGMAKIGGRPLKRKGDYYDE